MTEAPPHHVDWFRIIVDLERSGYSLERIGAEVLRSKGWVSNLKSVPGTQPRYADGMALLCVWADATGRRIGQAPREAVESVRNVR